MIEHVDPAGFHLCAVRLKIDKSWKLDTFEGAFFPQHRINGLLFGPGVGVSVEVHYVVEIAGRVRSPNARNFSANAST